MRGSPCIHAQPPRYGEATDRHAGAVGEGKGEAQGNDGVMQLLTTNPSINPGSFLRTNGRRRNAIRLTSWLSGDVVANNGVMQLLAANPGVNPGGFLSGKSGGRPQFGITSWFKGDMRA